MRATLADAQSKLAVVRRELSKKQDILQKVEKTLKKLKKEYEGKQKATIGANVVCKLFENKKLKNKRKIKEKKKKKKKKKKSNQTI